MRTFLSPTGFMMLAALFIAPAVTDAAEPLPVKPVMNGPVIGAHMDALEDPDGNLTIEEVSSPAYRDRFQPFGDTAGFGFTHSAYWFRLELDGGKGLVERLFLTLSYPPLDEVDFYAPAPGGGFIHELSGDTLPWHMRDVPFRYPAFSFSPAEGGMTLYLRVNARPADTITFAPRLWTEAEFNNHKMTDSLIMGAYYGMLVVMFFYNFLIYLTTNDKAYLVYVGYLVVLSLTMAALNGVGHQYLWSNSPWLQNQGLLIFMSLALAVGVQFNRVFLNTPETSPRFDRLFKGMIYASFAGAGAVFFIPYYYVSMALGGVAFLLIFLLINAYSGLLNHYRPARYYVIGWTILIVGAIAFALRNYGILPENGFTAWGFQTGTAIEVLLFSLALADRIADMQRREDKLRNEKEVAQTANFLKDKFMSLVSHDLRTPLSNIVGYAELTMEELDDGNPEQARALLQKTIKSSGDMDRMVSSLLRSSRFKTGQVQLAMEEVDAARTAATLINYLEEQAERKKVAVESRIAPGTMVKADPILFYEVLQNLVTNAVKFTPEGGRVVMTAEKRNGHSFIAVKDEGVGIKDEHLPHIFDMEKRVTTTGTGGETGTGLGLPLCKDIMEAHGGEIFAESQRGKGTSVYIRFNGD